VTKNQRNALRKVNTRQVVATSREIANGNSNRTYWSLQKKGLIAWRFTEMVLTDQGKKALAEVGYGMEP